MKAPEPGIFPGVSFDDYARWDAANHSILRHFSKTPAHVFNEITNQAESTKFQDLGHLIHFAVLEPERFNGPKGPVVAPDVDRRTKVGKAEWEDFKAAHGDQQIITADQMAKLQGIQRNVLQHPTAREALYGYGASELSMVWDEQVGEYVVRSKGRLDRICEIGAAPTILDVKSCGRPASTDYCQRAVKEYGYHQQAAFYLRGVNKLVPPDPGVVRKFVWLFCETEEPYCVRLFEAEDAALELGERDLDKYLTAYAECKKSGSWPAWPDGIDTLGLPAWAYKQFDLE